MTTAHRPTWKAAVGRAQEGGWAAGGALSTNSSAKDLASHTKLKFRKVGDELREALLQESLLKMEEAERSADLTAKRYNGEEEEERGRQLLLKQTADVDEGEIKKRYDDEDDVGADDDEEEDDDDLDSDDEDEEAALQAELAKIRAERAAAKAKEDAEAAAEEQAQMEEAALTGNPLLNSSSSAAAAASSGRIKRRWNDDVVFRNQAKNEPDQNKKRFINDTVRNDFHKRFLNKFI
ncbi:hypothetical protein THAPSDRAFT_261201, partial [Thalassiosira pseudonana CCMP1335]